MELSPLRPSNLIRVMPAKEARSGVVPRIHCITDLPCYDATALTMVEAVAAAGVDAVQVRAKELDDRSLHGFTASLVDRLRATRVRVLVNDRLDVALAAGAHGVHLGAEDLPVAAARAVAPPGFLIGATCRDAEQARRARVEGADYAGVGPVYPTSTKPGLPAPVGPATLQAAAGALPVVAVGGVDATRIAEVMASGAHGVAVAGAVWRAADPAAAAARIVAGVVSR
jgi:thiamine-phosphate pyrophosphorylase